MDRFAPINNQNQRYISNAIASNLAFNPSPPTPYPPPQSFNDANFATFPTNPPATSTGAVPISISEAQRQMNPMFGGMGQPIDIRAGHDSRVGEIMYDEAAGTTQKARSRMKSLNQPQPQPVGMLPFLFPGILTLILLVFVIYCIMKHRSNPFSQNSLLLYSQHPELLNDPSITDPSLTEALSRQQVQPNINYPGTEGRAFPESINQDFGQQFNQPDTVSPGYNGQCREGYYLLNGVCYPCQTGFWNGTKCITKGLGQSLTSTGLNNPQLGANISTTQTNITSTSTNPIVQTPHCRDGAIPVNGQCISCPSDSIWNGSSCQKIIVNSQTQTTNSTFHHLRRRV